MNHRLIPYVPSDISEPKDVVDAVRARRGGNLLNLDRILLHSIPFTRGWNSFLLEIRRNLTLLPKYRELGICGVAILNHAHYEFVHHAPEYLAAGGTEDQIAELRQIGDINSMDLTKFDPIDCDIIQLTIHMTRNIDVPSDILERLHASLGTSHTVEMIGVIAAYNMVSRFLIATNIQPEDH
jgi:alkylhydroperoxidase family enzyme